MARTRHNTSSPTKDGGDVQSPRSAGERGADALQAAGVTLTLTRPQLELLRGLVAQLVALERLQAAPGDTIH
jgi:hypothetical protein